MVAQNNSLPTHADLCQISKPKKAILDFSKRPVMVSLNEEDSLASNLINIPASALVTADAEIAEKIEQILFFDRLVEAVDDLGVHVGHIIEWSAAMPNDVVIIKMKVCGEPDIRHFEIGSVLPLKT
jgi:hypothetical protein